MLPTDPKARKDTPIFSGVLMYFPLALAEVARVSKAGNDQHNPGQPLHWDKSKSTDQHDCIVRHLLEAGTIDTDGQRHSAKLAWRALAALQLELEGSEQCPESVKLLSLISQNSRWSYHAHNQSSNHPCTHSDCNCLVVDEGYPCSCHREYL